MIAFAELLERLVFTPARNAKIALLRRYFSAHKTLSAKTTMNSTIEILSSVSAKIAGMNVHRCNT